MGCIYLFWHSGHEGSFLIRMGGRAVPAIKRQLDRAELTLNTRIYFAWILAKIGDYSYFQTFIEGLSSDRSKDQWIAVARMLDFPNQCSQYLPQILAVRGQRTHDSYWWLIEEAATRVRLKDETYDRIMFEIVHPHRSDKSPLTEAEQHEILTLLKDSANEARAANR